MNENLKCEPFKIRFSSRDTELKTSKATSPPASKACTGRDATVSPYNQSLSPNSVVCLGPLLSLMAYNLEDMRSYGQPV